MKTFSRLVDRLLLGAISWLGSPVRGLPEGLEADRLPGYRPAEAGRGRMRFAHA